MKKDGDQEKPSGSRRAVWWDRRSMGPVCRDLKFGAGSIQNTDKCEVRELLGSVLSRGGNAQIHLLARAIQLCWGKQSALRCAWSAARGGRSRMLVRAPAKKLEQ